MIENKDDWQRGPKPNAEELKRVQHFEAELRAEFQPADKSIEDVSSRLIDEAKTKGSRLGTSSFKLNWLERLRVAWRLR